jgi:hypothetical protein
MNTFGVYRVHSKIHMIVLSAGFVESLIGHFIIYSY